MIDVNKIKGFSKEELETYTAALPYKGVLAHLDRDELYYGNFGQQWHSNSFLTKLLDDPYLEKPDEVWGNGMYLVIGNFVHKAFLEPHKVEAFPYSTADSRRGNEYKQHLADSEFDGWMFLKKDKEKWIQFRDDVLAETEVFNLIKDPNNEFEVPMINTFNGLPIKGKCDIINHKTKTIIDLKTTSNLDTFAEKVDEWNYNVQAALYAKALFPDYEFRFIAVDKKTNRTGVFDISPSQFEIGMRKLYKCTNLYKHFHTSDAYKVYYHYL